MFNYFYPSRFFYYAYASFFCGTLFDILNFSYNREFRYAFFVIAMIFLFLYLILTGKILKLGFLQSLILSFFLLVIFLSYDLFGFILVMFFLSCNQVDLNKIFFISFCILSLVSLFVILSCVCCSLFDDVVTARNTSYGVGTLRHSLGFKWSFCLPNIAVYLCVYYLVSRQKINFFVLFIFQTISIILFKVCDSRNGLVSMELLLLLVLLSKLCDSNFFIYFLKKISILMYSFVLSFAFLMFYLYLERYSVAIDIDSMLSGRLNLLSLNYLMSQPSFFSVMSYDDFVLNAPYTMDSGYYYLVFRYGWWLSLFFAFLCYKIAICFIKVNNILGSLSLIVILMMSFIDNNFATYAFLPFYITGFFSLKHLQNLKC